MLSLFISIIGILITIIFVVGTHESAHFAMARLLNVKVLRFSIGFGKPLFRLYDKSGTEYVVAPIPLGGYVKMLDENEGNVPPELAHQAFNRQPYYKKFLIVIAGPAINLICAFLLYWLLFFVGFNTIKPVIGKVEKHSIAANANLKSGQEITSIDGHETVSWTSILLRLTGHMGDKDHLTMTTLKAGATTTHLLDLATWKMDDLKPDPLSSIGITPFQPDMPLNIGIIADNSPAATSGLKLGDHIVALDKQPVSDWEGLITQIVKQPGDTVNFTVKRDKKTLTIPVTLGVKHNWLYEKSGYLGIGPFVKWPDDMLRHIQYSPLPAAAKAWDETVTMSYFNFLLLGKLIVGKMSFHSLGGPITIFDSAGQALNSGWLSFIGFLAFISVALGVLNLLPIPGLDGGHLLIQTIEAIIRRPLPDAMIVMLYRCGMIVLLFIMIQAFMNDVLRLY